ncbi:TPA: hypothetical protein M5802_002557 [Morganella morganii]|uniref:tail fiber/spike domain-containing protein n=1 Tax=Morganella morganii TaxID=582 RepID=UPI00388D37AF|nr:hypothetical protein [Morganella morganii]
MATIPTQNAVPSEAPRDLKFNSGKIDEFVTSLEHEYKDRFGRCHMTIEGMRWIFEQLMERFKVDINQAIIAAGYIPMDSFQQGAEITKRNEILRDETTGEYYRWDGELPKSVPAGSTPESAGGIGMGAWVSVGDASVRQELEIVKRRMSVKSMSEFFLLECKDKETAILVSFYPGQNRGGGIFVYNAEEPRSNHNGVTIISPDVEFTDIESWLAVDQSRSGAGCWVKQIVNNTITSDECGCVPDGDSPVELPYFEKLSDIQKMKSYIPGADTGTDNTAMLQAMLDAPVQNKIITNGNYRITAPLLYEKNSHIFAYGAHVFASKDFGISVAKEERMLLKNKKSDKYSFAEDVHISGGRWDGVYRYFTYQQNALGRSISVGFSNEPDPLTNRMWSAFHNESVDGFIVTDVVSAFCRYMNTDAYAIRSEYKNCKSYYSEDDCYTSSSSGDAEYRTFGRSITYDNCEAWFAGFTSGGGSSGFEIDDGPDNAVYTNCRTYFCPKGFNQHVHPWDDNLTIPARNNYMWNMCSVFSSYIDPDFSPTSSVSGHAAFSVAGGDISGVNGMTFIGCYAEDNAFNDFYFNQAQKATLAPLSGIKIVGFQSVIMSDLSDVAMRNKESLMCAVQAIFESTSTAAPLANGVSISNSVFDGGGFKECIMFRGGFDVTIDSTNTFKNFGIIGRVADTGASANYKPIFKFCPKIYSFKALVGITFNNTMLRVEPPNMISDFDGIYIDASTALSSSQQIFRLYADYNSFSGVKVIGNGSVNFKQKFGSAKDSVTNCYFRSISKVNGGGGEPSLGTASWNILDNSVW